MIRIERRDAILEILIDRAERRNALTDAMYRDIERALREADADPACAAVILHGAAGTSPQATIWRNSICRRTAETWARLPFCTHWRP